MLLLPASYDPRQSPHATVMYQRRGAQIVSKVFARPSDVPANEGWTDSPDKLPLGEGRIIARGSETLGQGR